MSKCELRIQLEKDDATYRAGDVVRGVVHVSSGDKGLDCRALTVTLQWRTHGRGNQDKGPAVTQALFKGQWNADTAAAYAFELPAPAGPPTYHGRYVNVDHYVTARADVPWSMDPKAEVEILVLPPPDGTPCDFGPKYQPPQQEMHASAKGNTIASGFLLGCFGLPGLIGFVFAAIGALRGTFPWFALPLPLVFAAVGLGLFFLLQKSRLAAAKLGRPMIKMSPNPARAGETVAVQVFFEPRAGVTLTEASVALIGRESAVSGSGTNRSTHTTEVHNARSPLTLGARNVAAHHPVTLQQTVTVPEDAGATFVADDNELKWAVKVTIGVEGWADWSEDFPLTVRPR